jgi:predicted ATPase
VPSIQVPATVQAVLAARIDRLPPEEKRLLQTAAVIGREVPLALLQAIAELPEETPHRGLTHLQAAEFLYETRLFPEHAYTFKHALTHEVAYRSLLQERRRTLHTRIVEALEMLAGDRLVDQVERLADHAMRGEVWDKALLYCRQAGTKAMERSASREAVGCHEQALAALTHLSEHRAFHEQAIDLWLDLYSACMVLGQLEHALHNLRAAETLAEVLDDPRRLGRVSLYLAQYFVAVGQYDLAIASSQHTLTLAVVSGESGTHIVANDYLGMAYFLQGDYR